MNVTLLFEVHTMNAASVIDYEVRAFPDKQILPIVFVVDDDVSVRESLELLIRHEGWRVETFDSGVDFLNRPSALAPSCLVLDISMPGLNGLELQSRVAAERSDMPIIFITGHGNIPMTVQAMKAGAVEFLTKPFSDESLLSAIQNAIERSKSLVRRNTVLQALKSRFACLTSREREVFALVVAGLPNKLVGSELGISEITVKAHRGVVMRKMKAESLPELVNMAVRLRLIRPNTPSNLYRN
jgi:FixJ family two-component response regulator